jgi:multidrug efflux system outer membrane protein
MTSFARFCLTGAAVAALLMVGCTTLSEPAEVSVEAPEKFRGDSSQAPPPRADWWKSFRDSQLNGLVDRIGTDNFQLQAGLARIDQSLAVLGVSRSQQVPSLNAGGTVQNNRSSANDLGGSFFELESTQYVGSLNSSWEIDLWGRVRNQVAASRADAENIQRLTADLQLSLQTQLARNYFSLRFLDEEARVLRAAVKTRRDNLGSAKERFEGGRAGELDVARAEVELATAEAELARIDGPRSRLENAIAVLVGEAPANFRIQPRKAGFRLPAIGSGVPMATLQNRPDIAAAVSRLESTSARIGVAKAEFFPRIDLVGSGGLSSVSTDNFLDWSSRTFGIGPEVSIPLFQGGRLRANLGKARAEQAEALADYQQAVLDALREVEDALADLRALRTEYGAQQIAVKASEKSVGLSLKRYSEGLVSSIEWVDAIRAQLDAERRAVQIRGLQYDATVRLIQALGGGWSK